MEFTALPPEVTSALIHSGPGADSLIEASGAWQRLGTSLEESAGINAATLSSLAGAWHGPSAAAMTQAVEPYLTWLRTTAQQCQQMAVAVQDAIAAFNSARSSVVPVASVSANRTRLTQLLATNRFGINLPAIAETEDEYLDMWANNSGAMSRYEAASAQATTLPKFSSPLAITNPAGTAAQASVTSAATTSATPGATITPASILASIQAAAAGDPVNLGLTDPTTGYFGLVNQYANQFISSGFPINLLSYAAQNTSAQALQTVGGDIGTGLSEGQSALGAGAAPWRGGRVRRRRALGGAHGGDRCRSVGGQAHRAARRGGPVARIASAGPTRVGGNAAHCGRLRVPHAAVDAAADLARAAAGANASRISTKTFQSARSSRGR